MPRLATSPRRWPRRVGIVASILCAASGVAADPCAGGGIFGCSTTAGEDSWQGEYFLSCSSGVITSVAVEIDSVVTQTPQYGRLALGEGQWRIWGTPIAFRDVRLVRGHNVLPVDPPVALIGGREYFFALTSPLLFVWPMGYAGLAPPGGAAIGALAADRDWETIVWPIYCHFGFEIEIDPNTALQQVTWAAVKTLYREASP